MVGVGGAKNMAVRKVLKEGLCTAKPMVVVAAANTSAAPRAQKAARNIALHTAEAFVAAMRAAPELRGENLACAFAMEAARGAKGRTAAGVPRDFLVSAYLTAVESAVSFRIARRARKGAQCSARRMVEVGGVLSWAAQRAQRVARHTANATEEVSGAHFRAMVFVQRVFMVGHCSVLRMEVVRGALSWIVLRVLEGGLIIVSGMAVGSDANWRAVERAHKEALISARHTGVARGAHGAIQVQVIVRVPLVTGL